MTDKASLSPNPRPDEDLLAAILRMTKALGDRCAAGDPDTALYLRMVIDQAQRSLSAAVAGWRTLGFSDTQIARELGVTKQAVQQRWPR